MKQIILAAMVVMTMAGTANATSGWDYFWGTTVSQALDPNLNGWNDFWGQCQDPTKTAGDCVGTVAAGIGITIAAPVIFVTAVASGPVISTVWGLSSMPSIAGIGF